MSKKYVVLGVIIILTAGFLWVRGARQTETYTVNLDNYPLPTSQTKEATPETPTMETTSQTPAIPEANVKTDTEKK